MKDSFFISPHSSNAKKRSSARHPSAQQPKDRNKKAKVQKRPVESDVDEDPEWKAGDIDDMDLQHTGLSADQKLAREDHGDDDEHGSDTGAGKEDEELSEDGLQERRIRMAKQYIGSISKSADMENVEFDAADIDRELIASRLKQDALESRGHLFRPFAAQLESHLSSSEILQSCFVKNPFGQPFTCVDMFFDADKFDGLDSCGMVFTGAKDGNVIQWSVSVSEDKPSLKKQFVFPRRQSKQKAENKKSSSPSKEGHSDSITCLAVTHDGHFLATGSLDKRIIIWQISPHQPPVFLKEFTQHRAAISSLAFRQGTYGSLYSASEDRAVNLYNIDELAYVETLFGHQDKITAIDGVGYMDRCLTSGGRDRTVRLWKIIEESQLVFRAGLAGSRLLKHCVNRIMKSRNNNNEAEEYGEETILSPLVKAMCRDETGSVDCVAYLSNDMWISGSDGGTLCIWSPLRKKPVYVLPNAHGRTLLLRSLPQQQDEKQQKYQEEDECAAEIGNGDDEEMYEELSERLSEISEETESQIPSIFPTSSLNITITYETVIAVETLLNSYSNRIDVDAPASSANWISALATIPQSDVLITGSCDGYVRFWHIVFPQTAVKSNNSKQEISSKVPGDEQENGEEPGDEIMEERKERYSLVQIHKIPIRGHITSLKISKTGEYLTVCASREHSRGRWSSISSACNSIHLFKMPSTTKHNNMR